MQHIVSLSGGADSSAVLLWMINNNYPIDRVVYIETTKDFQEVYDNLATLQSLIHPIKIESYSFDFDFYFRKYGWARQGSRWCTREKVNTFERAVYGIDRKGLAPGRYSNTIEYHGIHKDEEYRKSNFLYRHVRYPLIKANFSAEDTVSYCYDHGLFFGGLYEILPRLSCFCCPLATSGQFQFIHDHRPALWREVLTMHTQSPYPFKPYHPNPSTIIKGNKNGHNPLQTASTKP